MTLGKPDEMPVMRWLLGEIKPSTLVWAAAVFLGAYYGVTSQMAVVQQKQAEQDRRIDKIDTAMSLKLDKEVYATQQQETHIELKGISDTVDRIEQFLMDHPRGTK